MRKREVIANPTAKHYVFEIIKTVVVAVIISLAAILIEALVVKFAGVPTGALPIINQVIKGVSILAACLICMRLPKNGWLRGIIAGLVYIMLAFVLFSLLNGAKFKIGLGILNDVALGAVSGLLSGIIATLIRGKRAAA